MKNLLLSVCMLVAGAAFAEIKWTGAGADNKWSTPENWSGTTDVSGLPTAGENIKISKINGNPITIDVDKDDCTCKQIIIESNVPAVTFEGEGTLTSTYFLDTKTSSVNNSPIRNLNASSQRTTFDCKAVFTGGNRLIFCGGLVFNGDLTITTATYIWFGSGASTAVDDEGHQGVLITGDMNVQSTAATVYMSNGATTPLIFKAASDDEVLHTLSFGFNCNGGSSVLFRKGRYRLTGDVSLQIGGVVNFCIDGADLNMNSTGNGSNPKIATNGFNFVSGKLSMSKISHLYSADTVEGWYWTMKVQGFEDGVLPANKDFTIRASTSWPSLEKYPHPLVINGTYNVTGSSSALTINQKQISGSGAVNVPAISEGIWDISYSGIALGFGEGGTYSLKSNGDITVFSNMTLVCNGAWRNAKTKTGYFDLGGKLIVDTSDAEGTGHGVYLETVRACSDLDLIVKGGGTAAFNWKSGSSTPQKLTVDDGATLLASNMTTLAVNELKFGSGAKMFMNAGGVAFPEGAVLSVTDALKAALDTAQTPVSVLTAKTITGLKGVSSEYCWKAKPSATVDGFLDLMVSKKQGLVLILR